MTRYADPERCPDCHAALTQGAPACGRCDLSLRGETAQRLYATLLLADDLLATLRAASVPAAAASATPFTPTPHPARAAAPRRRTGLSAASVPQVLLTLGAGCLLVAALVFLAVTWSVMGVGGRTATLLGFTAVAGGLAALMARRGLRAATESLAAVGYGLLVLDVLGAERAGWFGDLSASAFQLSLGVVLLLTGLAGAVAACRTAVGTLTCAEVVAALGTGLTVTGIAGTDRLGLAPSLVLGTLLAAAVAGAAHRLRLLVAAVGAGAVTVVTWLTLTGDGLSRALAPGEGWRELWLGLDVWPLLVAAALVAGPALLRRLTVPVRVAALAVGHLLLTCAVLAPVAHLGATTATLVALGVLVATSAVTVLSRRPWGLVNLATQLVAGAGVLLVGLLLAGQGAERLVDAARQPWSGSAGDRFPALAVLDPDRPAAWLLPLCVLALVGTAWALAEVSPTVDSTAGVLADLRLGAAVLAGSLVAALASYPVPLWLVLAALLLVTAAFTAWWLAAPAGLGSVVPLACASVFLGTAVVVALHDELLSGLVLAAAAAISAVVLLRGRIETVAALGGAALAGTVTGASWSFSAVAGQPAEWAAACGLLLLGGLVLLAPYAPGRWWAAGRPATPGSPLRSAAATAMQTCEPSRTTRGARVGLEASAAVVAVLVSLAGLDQAPAAQDSVWAAVYLTFAGAVVSALSLLRPDRRMLGWVGGGLLAAASWVRLWDLGVSAPEAYTLPTAAALVLVGLSRLRTDPASSTMSTLAPGLSLALVPSLLWAMTDPTGVRPLLVGLGCLLLVLAGARLGWTAPVALGATAGALLVLRLAAPYVGDAVPRWVLIGAAGALLVAVGATWERRLTEARTVVTYVRTLR